MTVLFTDFYLSTIANIIVPFAESFYGLSIFSIMIIASIVASHYLLNKLFVIMKGNRTAFSKYKKIIRVIQLFLYALGIILLIGIILENKYYTINIISLVTISYSCSIVASLLVSLKLFKWYRENKNKFSLLFGLTIFFIFINNLISLPLFDLLLFEKPNEINHSTPVEFNFECTEDSIYCDVKQNLLNYQSYTLMTYILLFWISSIFLLHHHLKKLGKVKFIILVTLPIIIFYFQFIYQYNELYTLNDELKFDENIIYSIQVFILVLCYAGVGIFFGLGLRSVANLMKFSPSIENYLKMASYGIMLFILAANSTIVAIGIPPFGTPSMIFLPFASILIYVGIYYSVIAISNDVTVRKYIKNSTFGELKILGKFAESQMLDNMKDKVLRMSKQYSEQLHKQSNTDTTETEEDLKNYLEDAIKLFNTKNAKE